MITDFNEKIIFFQYTILNTTWHTCSFSKTDCWVNVILLCSQIFQVTNYLPGVITMAPLQAFLQGFPTYSCLWLASSFIFGAFSLLIWENSSVYHGMWDCTMLQTDWVTPDCKGLECGVAVLGGHLGMGVSRSTRKSLVSCPG